jgi:hypothetical protein
MQLHKYMRLIWLIGHFYHPFIMMFKYLVIEVSIEGEKTELG